MHAFSFISHLLIILFFFHLLLLDYSLGRSRDPSKQMPLLLSEITPANLAMPTTVDTPGNHHRIHRCSIVQPLSSNIHHQTLLVIPLPKTTTIQNLPCYHHHLPLPLIKNPSLAPILRATGKTRREVTNHLGLIDLMGLSNTYKFQMVGLNNATAITLT